MGLRLFFKRHMSHENREENEIGDDMWLTFFI